ncbi:MAG: hypothetical protein WCJ35_05080 [Planctomycetota bacterium]
MWLLELLLEIVLGFSEILLWPEQAASRRSRRRAEHHLRTQSKGKSSFDRQKELEAFLTELEKNNNPPSPPSTT